MFLYNLRLAFVSLKRDPVLTLLMIGAVAIGIGMSTTTLAIYHSMSNNPIPDKSDQLNAVQMDSWSPESAYNDDMPTQVTYQDAMALIHAAKAKHQTADYISVMTLQTDNPAIRPYQAVSRNAFSDFFTMFEVPFQYGAPWGKDADQNSEPVVVLSQDTNQKLFGGANSVGKEITLNNRRFRIVGVLAHWAPSPKFYDLENDQFGDPEDIFIPFNDAISMQVYGGGNNSCWKDTGDNSWQAYLGSECVWIQFWVELPTTADRDAYKSFLDGYILDQKKAGRFPRPLKDRLSNVTEWLKYRKVVSNDSKALVGLSFMFLAVCMLNTIGLILAKFLRRSGEIGLRRAVGASRMMLFRQYLVETGVIGVSGGILGILLGWIGLLGVRQLISDSSHIAHLDWTMVCVSLLIALFSSMLAGLYPAWRVVRIPPAIYLKIQ